MNTVQLFVRIDKPGLEMTEDGDGLFTGYPLITAVPGEAQGELDFIIKNKDIQAEYKTVIKSGCMAMIRGRLWVRKAAKLPEAVSPFIPVAAFTQPQICILVDEIISIVGQYDVHALRSK